MLYIVFNVEVEFRVKVKIEVVRTKVIDFSI
jgi:hypothetical protein